MNMQSTPISVNVSAQSSALRLAAMGFKVCPLHPGKKCPVDKAIATSNPELSPIKGGPWRASSLSTEINRWFDDVPDANFGIVCCQLADGSWLTILDYDLQKNRSALQKHASALMSNLGLAPKDATYQTTPSGGVHLFVRTVGFRLDNAQDAGGIHGLDVRGQQGRTHGYVVAEGSTIKNAGKGYALHMGAATDATTIVEISMAQAIAAGLPIAGTKPASPNSSANPTAPNAPTTVSAQPATIKALSTTLMCGTALDWVRSQRDALLVDTSLKALPKDRNLWLKAIVLPLANAAADEPQHRAEFEQIADCVSRVMAGYDAAVLSKLTKEFNDAVRKAGQPGRLGVGSFGYGFGLLGNGSTTSATSSATTTPGAANAVSLHVQGAVQPPRQFAKGIAVAAAARPRAGLGNSPLSRGVASLLIGRGAVAKSTLAISTAFSIAHGGPSPLGWDFGEPAVARFVTLEDDAIDIGRTAAALGLHYGSVPGGLECCDATCADGLRLVDAAPRGGWSLNAEGMSALRDMAEGAAFLAVDSVSLVSEAGLKDNLAMSAVMGGVNRIARETGAHIMLIHHKRKGDDEDRGTEEAADSSMGAVNLVNQARAVFELRTMSESEARDRGIADRHRYAGLRIVKSNYGPVSDDAQWLEKRIIDISTAGGPARAVRLEHRVLPRLAATAALDAVRQLALGLIRTAEASQQPLANSPKHARSGARAIAIELMKAGHATGANAEKIAKDVIKALMQEGIIVVDESCRATRRGGGSREYGGLRIVA